MDTHYINYFFVEQRQAFFRKVYLGGLSVLKIINRKVSRQQELENLGPVALSILVTAQHTVLVGLQKDGRKNHSMTETQTHFVHADNPLS